MIGDIVIAGGGLAAQRCAETLRRSGHDGRIVMVCEERSRPYDRPPLSKEALHDGVDMDALSFRPDAWYTDNDVELLLGTGARGLRAEERVLELDGAPALHWDRLLIATGSRPRTLAQLARFDNVTSLRDAGDARILSRVLRPGARLLIIGAGFIGQEAASAARRAGADATIIEAGAGPLSHILGSEVGAWLSAMHHSRGVTLHLSSEVDSVSGGREVGSVTLTDGSRVECDHVLVAVGVTPSLDWLAGTPLGPGAIRADADGGTSLPGVFAAGDCAATLDPALGMHVPGNHWESAARQGTRAAKAMLGLDAPAPGISSFWSDLHGTRIQYLGHAQSADAVSFDGDREAHDFTATFTREGRPVAVLLAGRPQQLPQARQLLSTTTR